GNARDDRVSDRGLRPPTARQPRRRSGFLAAIGITLDSNQRNGTTLYLNSFRSEVLMGPVKIGKVACLSMIAFLFTVALLTAVRIAPENRTYTIGWEVDPPDQVATESGEPTGFAVELVREAAKRRGICLQWVQHAESSERALRSKTVDLWPMMTITEDRKRLFHLTDPYHENEFGLLVDAKSAFAKPGDLKHQTISYDGMPFNRRLLREHFPGSAHLRKSSLGEAVKSVCNGEAQAAFADPIAVFSLLL